LSIADVRLYICHSEGLFGDRSTEEAKERDREKATEKQKAKDTDNANKTKSASAVTSRSVFIHTCYVQVSKLSAWIIGSAVAVERIFSGGRDTISLRRASSLQPDTIRTLMLVKQRLCLARTGVGLIDV
jgi:hypothetical protein